MFAISLMAEGKSTRFEPLVPDSMLRFPLSMLCFPHISIKSQWRVTSGPTNANPSEPAKPFFFLCYIFCLQSLCKLVVGVPNRPLWRMLWIIQLGTGNGSLLLVHDLTMKVRDAQEEVSYVGVNQQRGPVGVSPTNWGPVGLDLGTAPQGPENRQHHTGFMSIREVSCDIEQSPR